MRELLLLLAFVSVLLVLFPPEPPRIPAPAQHTPSPTPTAELPALPRPPHPWLDKAGK